MGKDLVVYEKETRKIIAIILNTSLNGNATILNKRYDIIEVDNAKKYIICNDNTGEIKFQNPESSILYLKDFI